MVGLDTYISNIKKAAIEYLRREYNFNNIKLTDFELINFFLIDQAINNEKNLFVKTLKEDQKSEVYLTTILSISISLFFKNYCADSTSYEVGKIVQKNKLTYRIEKITDEGFELVRDDKYKTRVFPTNKQITSYSIINKGKIFNRKVKVGLDDYKKLFNSIFPSIKKEFPTEFQHKAVIIIEKKDFLRELKSQSITSEVILSKALPYQWVNKNGKFENTPIPIDPMMYLVPDYETFKEYIFESGIEVNAVIAIGKNKYHSSIRKIKRDLREEEVPFSIIIGYEDIDDEYGYFKKWNWTPPELSLLKSYDKSTISIIKVPHDEYAEKIRTFDEFINELNQQYSIKLSSFSGFKKLLYSLVLPSANSRLRSQIEYLKHTIKKSYSEEIDTALFNQNLNSQDSIEKLEIIVESIFDGFNNTKLDI
ncbi:MAG TPA: hypothetical protein VE912_08770, partial [Bacteroidales bacterium]|nr:hypothetical protein [Bacteroidales bacterium]